jgi:hypothetical protein
MALESSIGWRGTVFVAFCVLWFLIVLLPSLSRAHGPHGSSRREQQLSQILLTSIMTTWLDQQRASERSSTLAFDKQAASKTLWRGVSPWTDQALRQRRGQVQDFLMAGQILAALFVLPLAVVALLWGGRVRRVACVVLILFIFVAAPSLAARQISALFVPGTHAYLDDYVYLSNVDLLHPTGKIAAYDLPSSQQGRWHVMAFDDGHVEILGYDRARPLFEQQGIPYPTPPETGP